MKYPTEGHILVTPKMASDWLLAFNYEHQRRIRTYHVASLRDEILAGRFRPKTQITFCRFENNFFLTNGQHTLSAIVAAERPIVLDVIINDVGSREEIADDYARHDTHLTRQLSDSLVAHDLHTQLGVTVTQLSWLAAACIFTSMMKGEISRRSTTQVSHDVKLNTIMKYGELAKEAIGIISHTSVSTYLTRKTTLSCVMITLEKQPELCREFFGNMVLDDGLRQGDPRKTLLEFLKVSRTAGGVTGTLTSKKGHADHELVKYIAGAWNAYCDRRDLKVIRIRFDEREIVFNKVGTFSV